MQLAGLSGDFLAANIPEEACGILNRIFEPMAQRIDHLHRRVIAKQN